VDERARMELFEELLLTSARREGLKRGERAGLIMTEMGEEVVVVYQRKRWQLLEGAEEKNGSCCRCRRSMRVGG